MPRFTDDFLDDLRARVRVSDVVSRKYKLRKSGVEFVAIDNPSLTVNDRKQLWFDHGNSARGGGDVFKWFQDQGGLGFTAAVEALVRAALAREILPVAVFARIDLSISTERIAGGVATQ